MIADQAPANACAGCGHVRSHHPRATAPFGNEVTECRWKGCGCPWFVQRIEIKNAEHEAGSSEPAPDTSWASTVSIKDPAAWKGSQVCNVEGTLRTRKGYETVACARPTGHDGDHTAWHDGSVSMWPGKGSL